MFKITNQKPREKFIDTVLVPLFWALNIFHALLWCFPCWLWTSNCPLGNESYHLSIFLCMHIIQLFLTIFSTFTQKTIFYFLVQHVFFPAKNVCFYYYVLDVFEKSNEYFSSATAKFNEKKISRSVWYLATTRVRSVVSIIIRFIFTLKIHMVISFFFIDFEGSFTIKLFIDNTVVFSKISIRSTMSLLLTFLSQFLNM